MEAFKLAQLASAYGQSLLAYKIDGAPKPFSATFVVSNRCNIQCSYCNFPKMDPTELGLETIDIIFSRLEKMGVKRLSLMGGEPLLRKDFLKIIELAKSHKFYISINTNLLLYEKFKEKLDDVDYFFTSLDGNLEKHNANRGSQNYERIIEAIRSIVSKGKKIVAICVVTEPDIAMADYLIDLAKREKFMIHFQPECYDTEIVLRSAPSDAKEEEIRKFWRYLLEKKKDKAPISTSEGYLKYISAWNNYTISSYVDPAEKCAAGRGFLFVDAQGYAYPCGYTKGKMDGISLINEDWNVKFDKYTPCTKCIVGPMLEFNLAFQKPVASLANAWKNI